MSNGNTYVTIEELQALKQEISELKTEIKINILKTEYVQDSIHYGFFSTIALIGLMALMIVISNKDLEKNLDKYRDFKTMRI